MAENPIPISNLPQADTVNANDLLVIQQNNEAKSVTGTVFKEAFATMLDGHGGIYSITLDSTVGLVKTYKITYADETLSYFTVSDGEQGLQGLQTYVHIRYSAAYPVQTILTTPNNYIGIYTGTSSSAPTNSAQYTWFLWKGQQGNTGVSITSIVKTSTSGNVDTYTITFSNSNTQTFNVTNGSNISSITKTGTNGLVDTYTVLLTNGTTSTFTVTNAKSITTVELISGNHNPGTTDTYQISFNNGDTATFTVYNGANGEGAVSTVAGIPVVGDNGDVPIIQIGNTAPTTSTVGYLNQFYYNTTGNSLYICTAISGNTYTWSGFSVTVDSTLSSSSENPVQNKVIYNALAGKVSTGTTVNGNALSSNVTLTAADVGAVPTSRTINGNALTSNITTQLTFTNISVATSSFVSDSTYTGYSYKAVISASNVTSSMTPIVVFAPDDALSGNFAPVASPGSGSVTIYAKAVPESAITIPTILCVA